MSRNESESDDDDELAVVNASEIGGRFERLSKSGVELMSVDKKNQTVEKVTR